MPTIRYEIRNEYGLADPELHRAADKDDPEAVLEGVAMAGLVGVLRQLGDLAEFAAEIFHDLHEEVMCTAARGHGLTLRVQQLEAEFPSLEKAFFSQSTHSSFNYNDGTDWHANVQINQNLVTQGDMPRFVLDSYEECRGPPRLFMLDKFDIAGAGACLKRYSDPSFFKMELASSSGMGEVDIPREKRSRKMKKKGPRWKNGKTLESLLLPNGKESSLQLANIEKVSEKPAFRFVRLKSRHFNRDKGRSLMERLLELHSDMQTVARDASRSHLNGKLETINLSEQDSVLHDIVMDKSISHLSPKDENALTSNHGNPILLPTYKLEYEKMENELLELPLEAVLGAEETNNVNSAEKSQILANSETKSGCNINHCELGDDDKVEISKMAKQVLYDSEINLESSGDGYRSDDIGSEQENFLDALNTMESEVETDSDSKHIQQNFDKEVKTIEFDSVEGQEELNTQFSEQQYVESSFSVHMNSNITSGLLDSEKSDTLNHMSKTKSTKEVFFTSNQDQDLAIDLGESHGIICDEIWPKSEVPTSVNLNSNNIHDIELSDHSGLRSEPEEVPCSSFPTEQTSIANLHPQECSDELLSDAAVKNGISASYNRESEGHTIVNGSHMNDHDPEGPHLAEYAKDLVSEIMTETVEMSTHISRTCETSTENCRSECSLFTSSMPTVSETWESNDEDSEAFVGDGSILSATPFIDNINALASQSGLVIAEIQNSFPLEHPLADGIRQTDVASNNTLNASLGTGVEHEDEDCYVEYHSEASDSEVLEIKHSAPDYFPVFKDEVDEEASIGYNEDAPLPLIMQEMESQIANEDTTIKCRVPDHFPDIRDESNGEVALGDDEDLSLPLTMQKGESREALNEDMTIGCRLPNEIGDIKDEDKKEAYLEYVDLSSPLTMQERETHEVLNEDIASRCDMSQHRPNMKHDGNGDISVGYNEDVALPLITQKRESHEAFDEDIKIFSSVGLSSDLSTLSAIGTGNCINDEKLSYDGSSVDIAHIHEMPVNNLAMLPELAHFSDTQLQPSDKMDSEEEERTPYADLHPHLRSNISDLSGYPVPLSDNLKAENVYTGYGFEKERKQTECNFLSDEVSSGIVSAKDESHEFAHLDASSALSPGISSSKKQLDEYCVSSPLTSHPHELKVHETCNQKDTDMLDSQRSPDDNSSSPEEQIEQNFLSDEVSSGFVFSKNESHVSAHLDPSSGLSPDISSSNKQLDEDCVSIPVTSHLHELKDHETCNQKDTDLLDSQWIPDINSSSQESQVVQNFLSDEVSSGIVFAKDKSHESAHLDPSSGSSPDISSSKMDEDCVSIPVTSHLHELKVRETCNQNDTDASDSQRIPDINSSSPEKPESGAADQNSNLFAEDLSGDKNLAFSSCISCSQIESLSTSKKSFPDDYSLERKHVDGARSFEQSPCETIEEISSSIKFLPASLHEEASKLEVRGEENVTTTLEEHLELEILTNSTDFDTSLPPSSSSHGDVDSYNGSLDIVSSKGDIAKRVESDAFISCTNDYENLSSSGGSDLSVVLLPQFPRLNVTNSKSTMPVPDDNQSDQSSCLPLSDVEEPPPLPPLPPIGWRTGKLHEKTLSSYGNSIQHIPETGSLVPSSDAEYKAGLEYGRRVQPANQFANVTKLEEESIHHGLLTTEEKHMHPLRLSHLPPILHDGMDQHEQFLLMPNEKSLHDPNALSGLIVPPAAPIPPLTLTDEIPQQVPSLQQDKAKSLEERSLQIGVIPDAELERVQDSHHGNANLDKEIMQHQNLFVAQSSNENEAYHSSHGICRANDVDIKSLEPQFTPMLEAYHPGYVVLVEQNPSNHYGVIWSSEAQMPIVRPSSLRNRPRNPLIEAVAAHDRSTMRKVSELVRPPTNKSDERDSLLEQIRNKAFSLKPAASTKQNMKAPLTNLKVAAIIEKANAIRQACAGSDEDDDADSWSDS